MSDSPTAEMIGKYRILGELGRGGMGVVYLAEDTTLRRRVALKVMNPALAEHDVFLEQFRAEAHALAAINNPHVVRIHSLDTVSGSLLIDMELLEGGSLADVMAQRAVPVPEAVALCRDMLTALSACHSTGLIHRDIKPANVLFDNTGHACIADFGLAAAYAKLMENALEKRASTGMLWGTPCYAPPEAWDGQPPSPAWDVYATGIVLYEAIARTHPFNTSHALTLLHEMNQGDYAPLRNFAPDTPDWLESLLKDMLQPLPQTRLPDATTALEKMPKQTDASRVVRPSRTTVAMVPRHTSRRLTARKPWRKTLATVAIVSVVAAALSAAFWLRGTPVRTQSDVFQRGLPAAETLSGLWKAPDPAAWQVYDTYTYETSEHKPGNWLVHTNTDGSLDITMADPAALARLALHRVADNLEGQGGWAEHPNGDLFQLDVGVLSGTGTWMQNGRALLVGYEQRSSYDGRSWNRSVLATPSASLECDTAFLLELESRPALQSLLFNELSSLDLAWPKELLAMLPAMANGRASVSRAVGDITVDGVMDEPTWASLENSRSRLPGYPLDSNAWLYLRDTGSALVLGVEADALAEPGAQLSIVLCNNFQIPVTSSERWHFTLSRDGTVDSHRAGGGKLLNWDTPWRAAFCAGEGCGSVEVEIPFEGPRAEVSDIVRMNVSISTDSASTRRVLWGYPDPDRVEHGILASLRDE